MTNEKIKLGFALTGSFCTFDAVINELEKLSEMGTYDIIPIMSANAYSIDTRFGTTEYFNNKIETICQNKIIHTIAGAEPIGPKKMLDILLIAPCTGNTIGKLANGIYDTSVTLAYKAHLRNQRPVVIAVSTNDALSVSAKNIGVLFNNKNVFFVPMRQDNPVSKETSVVADFSKIGITLENALIEKQVQPIFM
ncbi:MAG: dipicolinate synthase subunit B [Oscillospiraceae bacterium]